MTALTIVALCAVAAVLLALFPRHGTGRHRASRTAEPVTDAAPGPHFEEADTTEIPLLKLYDPDTEKTLTIALPAR